MNIVFKERLLNSIVRIYNSSGILVTERKVTESSNRIDFSNLPTGIYFVHIIDVSGVATGKISKR